MLKLPKAIADSLTIATRSLNTSSLFVVIWVWFSFSSSGFILREVERNMLKNLLKLIALYYFFLFPLLPQTSLSESVGEFIFFCILALEILEMIFFERVRCFLLKNICKIQVTKAKRQFRWTWTISANCGKQSVIFCSTFSVFQLLYGRKSSKLLMYSLPLPHT